MSKASQLDLRGVLVELEEARGRLEVAAGALLEASVELDARGAAGPAARAERAAVRCRQDALAA